MLSLLAPGALLALAVLAVPPLLHLRRRSEQKQVRFAALRWLGAGARPRRQVRLEQRLLLLARLCLLTLLVLLLAVPVWHGKSAVATSWAVVAPGLDPAAARAAVDGAPGEWHWLAPGFPAMAGPVSAAPAKDWFSLLRQLDSELAPGATLQIVVPQELSGLDAERPRLRHEVNWHVLSGAPASPIAQAASGNALKLALRYDAEHGGGLPLVRALAAAWRATGLSVSVDEAPSDAAPAGAVDALFWLGDDLPAPLLRWARSGGTLVAGTPAVGDGDATPATLTLGHGRVLLFSAPLDAARNPALRTPELPARLLAQLRHDAAPPDRAPAASVAPLLAASGTADHGDAVALDRWAALLAALLFAAERLLALRAARSRA